MARRGRRKRQRDRRKHCHEAQRTVSKAGPPPPAPPSPTTNAATYNELQLESSQFRALVRNYDKALLPVRKTPDRSIIRINCVSSVNMSSLSTKPSSPGCKPPFGLCRRGSSLARTPCTINTSKKKKQEQTEMKKTRQKKRGGSERKRGD